jgi:hypothetical protein
VVVVDDGDVSVGVGVGVGVGADGDADVRGESIDRGEERGSYTP